MAERAAGAQDGPGRLSRCRLLWIVRGLGAWNLAGGGTIPLRPGTVVLARSGAAQHICWDERHPSRYGFADFDLAGPEPVLPDAPFSAPAEPPLAGLLDYLEWLGTWRPSGWDKRAEDVIDLLVTLCVAGPLRHGSAESPPPVLIRDALDFVHQEWSDGRLRPIRLGELAAASSVSAGHFARRFQQHFGVGAADALERLRLVHAAELLLHSATPLADIAEQCGFVDAYHFSRRFSRRYGVPPGRCRRDGLSIDTHAPLTEVHLQGLAARVWPSRYIEQAANTSAPAPLRSGHTYGQAFSVPGGLFLTNVNFLLATYSSRYSGSTITLFRGRPGGRLDPIAVRQIRRMTDNTTESLQFAAQPAGSYYLQLSNPHGTPTWWWHQGRDVSRVGGCAYIDDEPVPDTNFIFSAHAERKDAR